MKRILYFDILNVFACLSVIALHCNGYTHTFAHDAAWKQAIFFETIFYSAVPIFFMLSGATLLGYKKRYNTKDFYKKRFIKTFIPYILFGIMLYVLHFLKLTLHSETNFDISNFLSSMLTGQIPYANYWFFIPLFVFYLFTPFLEKITTNSSIKELFILVSIIFFFQAIIPIINDMTKWGITQSTSIYGYSAYAILGYALSKTDAERNKRILIILCITTLSLWAIRYTGLYHSYKRTSLLFNYFGLYAVIPATSIFFLAKRLNSWLERHNKISNKISILSSLSFGVYLTHGIVLAMLPFTKDSFSYRIIGIPIVYISCCIIVFFLKKIPFVQKIVP